MALRLTGISHCLTLPVRSVFGFVASANLAIEGKRFQARITNVGTSPRTVWGCTARADGRKGETV